MQRNSLINLLKGFLIGVGKILPGVSGGIIAIILGVYDKSIYYLSNIKKEKINSIKYLFPILIGLLIGIILFSKILLTLLNKYYYIVMFFFIGLIIGTVPEITNKIQKKKPIIIIISFIIIFLISISTIETTYQITPEGDRTLIFILSGFIEAIATVIPGISSSALLMIIGTYKKILELISNITNIIYLKENLNIIIPFISSLIITLILTIRLVDILLKKYDNLLYNIILGILMSSIILLIIKVVRGITFSNLIIGSTFLILGIIITYKIKKES